MPWDYVRLPSCSAALRQIPVENGAAGLPWEQVHNKLASKKSCERAKDPRERTHG